ncbi:MAG: hypothetical protein AVDCRST_MAG90-222, partial [uncultured Microvirga sp.]
SRPLPLSPRHLARRRARYPARRRDLPKGRLRVPASRGAALRCDHEPVL